MSFGVTAAPEECIRLNNTHLSSTFRLQLQFFFQCGFTVSEKKFKFPRADVKLLSEKQGKRGKTKFSSFFVFSKPLYNWLFPFFPVSQIFNFFHFLLSSLYFYNFFPFFISVIFPLCGGKKHLKPKITSLIYLYKRTLLFWVKDKKYCGTLWRVTCYSAFSTSMAAFVCLPFPTRFLLRKSITVIL